MQKSTLLKGAPFILLLQVLQVAVLRGQGAPFMLLLQVAVLRGQGAPFMLLLQVAVLCGQVRRQGMAHRAPYPNSSIMCLMVTTMLATKMTGVRAMVRTPKTSPTVNLASRKHPARSGTLLVAHKSRHANKEAVPGGAACLVCSSLRGCSQARRRVGTVWDGVYI